MVWHVLFFPLRFLKKKKKLCQGAGKYAGETSYEREIKATSQIGKVSFSQYSAN